MHIKSGSPDYFHAVRAETAARLAHVRSGAPGAWVFVEQGGHWLAFAPGSRHPEAQHAAEPWLAPLAAGAQVVCVRSSGLGGFAVWSPTTDGRQARACLARRDWGAPAAPPTAETMRRLAEVRRNGPSAWVFVQQGSSMLVFGPGSHAPEPTAANAFSDRPWASLIGVGVVVVKETTLGYSTFSPTHASPADACRRAAR